MSVLTMDQRKLKNFRNSFFYIEGLFYFFQGIFAAGLQVFSSYYMTKVFMLDMAKIASIGAMIGIPMYLKMFTGLLSDKVPVGKFGRRKPYLLFGGIIFAVAFAFLLGIQEFSGMWIFAMILCQVGFVFVDGTADALTVDVTPDEHATKMQGYANGGRYAGMAIGILVSSFLPSVIGWTPVLIVLAVAAILQAVAAMMFKEIKIEEKKDSLKFGESFKLGFGNRGAVLGLFFSVLFMGSFGVTYILNPLTMENVTEQVFGIANLLGYAFVAAAAWGTGTIVSKRGGITNKNIYVLFGLIWVFMLPWLLVRGNWDNAFLVVFATVMMGISRGIVTVVTYAVLMRLCSEALEGFMFAIFTSLMNIGLMALTPNIVAYFGVTLGWGMIPALYVMIPVMLLGVLLVPGINKSLAQKEERLAKVEQSA